MKHYKSPHSKTEFPANKSPQYIKVNAILTKLCIMHAKKNENVISRLFVLDEWTQVQDFTKDQRSTIEKWIFCIYVKSTRLWWVFWWWIFADVGSWLQSYLCSTQKPPDKRFENWSHSLCTSVVVPRQKDGKIEGLIVANCHILDIPIKGDVLKNQKAFCGAQVDLLDVPDYER